jgi:hypothetical protein
VPYRAPGLAELDDLTARARAFVDQSNARNTVRAYRSGWRHFDGWCRASGLVALPAEPDTVALT